MHAPIVDQVVDFYYVIFERIFSDPFRPQIADRLKRDDVISQVQRSAGAASQSLTRFFLNQQLDEQQVAHVFEGFEQLGDLLKLDDVSNPNVSPETVVDELLSELPCPQKVQKAGHDAVYRVGLHSVVQVLMLVGPVMAEWGKLNFSSTYELPRRVVNRMNQISEQMDALGRSGQEAADERYELNYRDYLLQRFHRVEAGTVRMTTNMDVDLRELFVMPRLLSRALEKKKKQADTVDAAELMDLAAAREFFGERSEIGERAEQEKKKRKGLTALYRVKRYPRNVIVGPPGSGKSTFLEWLQIKLAAGEEELVMAGSQAIPLLLRMRELDPQKLPNGAELIEKATASKDRAALMPPGWIERQMDDGRVLFMLDGLDETEPELRDKYVIPWLRKLCRQYSKCRYLVSSRPVGYTMGMLRSLKFTECDLLDFEDKEIAEYTRHWCTAVRLAQNEPEGEARREGTADGEGIVGGFKGHPYIRNLARNPLMLSAICLVNYFEGGQLPEDRAILYKLCVEGLLHNWDQRRGIHSEFTFDEKLRTCREAALTMQADDRAEYEAERVQEIFTEVLGDSGRAEKLLGHIRYRTGLLLERRPGIFAFAHLTFQEYLAARAVHEGNKLGIDAERLVGEHDDGRWREVIPLYCGLAPSPIVRDMIEMLTAQPDTLDLSTVLTDAYLSAGVEISEDHKLRRKTLERIALAPGRWRSNLEGFPEKEVARIANRFIGKIESEMSVSESFLWLIFNPEYLNMAHLVEQFKQWRRMNSVQNEELNILLHYYAPDKVLLDLSVDAEMYETPTSIHKESILTSHSQAEIALAGLSNRLGELSSSKGVDAVFLQILRALLKSEIIGETGRYHLDNFLRRRSMDPPPNDTATWLEFSSLAHRLADQLSKMKKLFLDDDLAITGEEFEDCIEALNAWADSLDSVIAEKEQKPAKSGAKSKSRATTKRAAKPKGRK